MSRKSTIKEHLRSGLQAFERGLPELARTHFQQVVALDPANAKASLYLGTVLLQLDAPDHAVTHLEHASRSLRDDAHAIGNLARAYFALERWDDARAAFEQASKLVPQDPQLAMGAANSAAMQKRFDDAARMLEVLALSHPNAALIWYNLGNVRREQGRFDDADRCFTQALRLDPGFFEAHNSRGSVLHSMHRFEDAEEAYQACLTAAPSHGPAQLNLISLWIDTGRFAEAERRARELIAHAPHEARLQSFLGAALEHQGKLLQALEHEREAARLAPGDAKLAENVGSGLARLGRHDEAWPYFERALRLDAGSRTTREARAHALLSCGRLAEGWADYSFRPRSPSLRDIGASEQIHGALPQPAARNRILLLAEQGLGDELFFLRYVPRLMQQGWRAAYRASPKVAALLERAQSVVEIVAASSEQLEDDWTMLVGDLPRALEGRPAVGHSPHEAAEYPEPFALRASEVALAAARTYLLSLGPPPYVAITWAAGTPPREQRAGAGWVLHKTVDVSLLATWLRDVAGTMVSVQRNPQRGDLEAFAAAAQRPIHDASALNEDLEAMLALLTLVDDYVGVSNTNMHLRAGVGKPARVLVPGPAEWRWGVTGERSPWFPNFKLYRQAFDGDWSQALAALAGDLRQLHGDRSG